MISQRKGARRISEIPEDILQALNQGSISTANLVEYLAIDHLLLIKHVLKSENRETYISNFEIIHENTEGINRLNKAYGQEILALSKQYKDEKLIDIFAHHPSDMIRTWAAYAIGSQDELPLKDVFQEMYPLANDEHFQTRENAWLAVRHRIIEELNSSLNILQDWVLDEKENIRRFAIEGTRPRGVWCKHIQVLKDNPALAFSLLNPLKSDASKYVRDAVGNWLNDASKTQPNFVTKLCKEWEKSSPTEETDYIIKRALRTINKKK